MIEVEIERRAASVGLLVHPRPDLGAIAITGRDRLSWLNGLVTCELAKAKPGDGAYGLAVGKTGKVLAELWIAVAAERLVVAVAREGIPALIEHLERHLIMEDVEVGDASTATRWLFVHGPRVSEALDLARANGADAAAVEWTGRGDAGVIAAPADSSDAIAASLLELTGAVRAGDDAWDALRIRWGLPRFGRDYDGENLPHEASLDKLAVSFTKGCYLGQEAVFMLEARGHAKKHLAQIEVPGVTDLRPGAPVSLPDGTAVGEVTSAIVTGEGTLAIAYVKHKHANAGAELVVAGHAARLVDLAARPRASG